MRAEGWVLHTSPLFPFLSEPHACGSPGQRGSGTGDHIFWPMWSSAEQEPTRRAEVYSSLKPPFLSASQPGTRSETSRRRDCTDYCSLTAGGFVGRASIAERTIESADGCDSLEA